MAGEGEPLSEKSLGGGRGFSGWNAWLWLPVWLQEQHFSSQECLGEAGIEGACTPESHLRAGPQGSDPQTGWPKVEI